MMCGVMLIGNKRRKPTIEVRVMANAADQEWEEHEFPCVTGFMAIVLGQSKFQHVIAKLPTFWVSLCLEMVSWRFER